MSVDEADFEELENALLKDPNDKNDPQPPIGKPASTPQKLQGSFYFCILLLLKSQLFNFL